MDALLKLISDFAPNHYAQAAIIIVLFIIGAKILNFFITRILRGWAEKTESKLDDQVIDLVDQPIFITLVIIGLDFGTELLRLPDSVNFVTVACLRTIVIAVWMVCVIRLFRLLLEAASEMADDFQAVQEQTLPLFTNLATIVVVGGALYFFFVAWNINVTAWVASAGIVGIAISFAARDTLANLFSGIFILADAPYRIGDYIVLDSGERGEVTEIGIRSTRLLTRDDVEVTIPNSVMGNAKITNEAGGPSEKHRIRVAVSVAYGSDIDQVKDILMEIARSHFEICEQPEPRVRFRSFGDSGLEIELLGWIVEPVLRGRVLDALNTEIYKRFMDENIEIPYPKRDVYMRSAPND